jgi:hypothetical protein
MFDQDPPLLKLHSWLGRDFVLFRLELQWYHILNAVGMNISCMYETFSTPINSACSSKVSRFSQNFHFSQHNKYMPPNEVS